MARTLDHGETLVVASHNKGKVGEIAELVKPFGIDTVSAGALNLPEPEETEDSFIGNALLKAKAAAKASGKVALADDSGLCVAALDGAPGIYSARWAGPTKDFAIAMQAVQTRLEETGSDNRAAHFICALALCWPDGHTEVFEGRVDGQLVWPPRGDHGFGYDPVFQATGHDITFGQMDPAKKHAMSHRADAFAQMVGACFES